MQTLGGWQKNEIMLGLDELLEQNFLRYDGKGEVPSQIHSYLSSNFKELRNLAKDDPSLKAKGKDRWYVPDPNKASDLEKLRELALMREFSEYLPAEYKRAKPESQEVFIPGLEPNSAPIPEGKKMKVIRLEAVRAGFLVQEVVCAGVSVGTAGDVPGRSHPGVRLVRRRIPDRGLRQPEDGCEAGSEREGPDRAGPVHGVSSALHV